MKKRKNIYLPKWQRWFVAPIMLGVWIFITYMEFFSGPETRGEMGSVGYAIMSLLFLGIGTVTFLMASGKLPAYVVEEEVFEDKDNE
ncbi:MAG: hypothetical protein R3346_00145 [Candidatus Spechtbacterales bacterium]|nr:hypothetical protein [Candidatus Spechtbacterales bacterium]